VSPSMPIVERCARERNSVRVVSVTPDVRICDVTAL
jgi:hypothetical protein